MSDYNNDRIQKIQVTPQLIIKAGEDKGVMTFNSIADSADEIDETIEITPISDATINGVNNFSDTVKITITDISDPPDVSLALDSQSIFENSSSEVKLTASIPVISGKEIQIPLLIEGTAVINEEFTISSSSIIIDPGKFEGHILISTAGLDDDLVEIIETIVFKPNDIINANTSQTEIVLNLISDDNPNLNAIEYDKESFAEHETVTITAKISEPHSKDVLLPISLSGTSILDSDYSVDFVSKGVPSIIAGNNNRGSNLKQLNTPINITVDNSNNIYIADFGNGRIVKYEPNSLEGKVLIDNLNGPYAIEVNDEGDIYVVENYAHRVSKFIFSGDDYTQVIVAGGNGEGTELNQLFRPMDLHLDESDNLYVLDTYNHRVVKWLPGAIQGSVVAGGNNNGSDLNQLYYPHAFSVDDSGNIYIADWDNRRIVKWDVNSSEGTILKDENNSNLRGNFIGIHVDNESGNIYASDHYDDIVKKFTPISNNQYSSSVVAGRDNGWGNGSSKIDELRNPRGVNLDNNKNLLVADQENHRIIKVQLSPVILIMMEIKMLQ